MNIRTCSDCRYEKEDASSEVCTNCHGIIKGEPSNWENKSCLVCVNFGKGVHVKPCKDCIYNKYKPSFELDKKENKEMEEIKTCSNCKHASDGLDDDICEQCSMEDRGGTVCYWEARNKTESKQEDEELQEEIASHDSKQGDFLDIEKRTEEATDNLDGFVPRLGTEEHFDEHYHDKVQPLEIMQEIMTPEEFRGFLFGNIIKYSCRCGKKDEPQKEFAKLRRYREWYDKSVLCEHIDPRI